jgi:hypothetical protein
MLAGLGRVSCPHEGAAVARAADGPNNISSSARVLAPSDRRDAEQPGKKQKQKAGATRAPEFHRVRKRCLRSATLRSQRIVVSCPRSGLRP